MSKKFRHTLYVANSYAPPGQVSSGPSTRHYYHVQALTELSDTVTVVTSDSSPISEAKIEDHSEGAVKVRTVRTETVRGGGLRSRVQYHVAFFGRSLRNCLEGARPDLVVASMPTLLVGTLGVASARRFRSKLLIDVRDMWSESLETTALGRYPLVVPANRQVERFVYKQATSICCTSPQQQVAVRQLAARDDVYCVPNGVDPEISHDVAVHPKVQEIKERFPFVGLFAGKHGGYTDLDNVITASHKLRDSGFAAVLVGGGYAKPALVARVKEEGIQNVFFFDPVPKTEIAQFEKGADVFLINYSQEQAWARVLPNKLFDYMYWEKPIVAAVPRGEISRVLDESSAGTRVDPETPGAFADALSLYMSGEKTMGNGVRDYLLAHYDRRKTVGKFKEVVERL